MSASPSDLFRPVNMTVNGQPVSGRVEARTLLSSFLRDQLALTGTHIGCDTSQCGSCVVLMNGFAVKACAVLALQAEGAEILTIEGLTARGTGDGSALHPMQEAFQDHHALQCGFCTPGMVLMALELVRQTPEPTEAQVMAGLEGNYCRCTGYAPIVRAILDGAGRMRASAAGRG